MKGPLLQFDFIFQMHIKTLDSSNNALLNKRRKREKESANNH